MPDFLAGQTMTANHFPPTVADFESGLFTFTHTTYAITGEPATVGVAFTAAFTGRACIDFACGISNSTTATTAMVPVVREGTTVGSGTTFLAANDDNAVAILPNTFQGCFGSRRLLVTGLTPGASYNVRLEHRVSSGTGTLNRRSVTVAPAT